MVGRDPGSLSDFSDFDSGDVSDILNKLDLSPSHEQKHPQKTHSIRHSPPHTMPVHTFQQPKPAGWDSFDLDDLLEDEAKEEEIQNSYTTHTPPQPESKHSIAPNPSANFDDYEHERTDEMGARDSF